ncbi:endonuclease/exonuclease/phosphatase family protein [Falsirhodobacter halotolerans]|uniref:endonuclease/exonuclease/phosphatase family protein n=1 Tax=Falsirhodobacter halotolerans TaxID=1146892 RepID=UPI001FD3F228|nr:endonuclease/exonuclease/phosphatase family protein [Falsirhodobacter halotolerans]MCJ8140752.1 endonuclease/exonuclease/phosphatase family protein [Falsirhodobacter halotolerans]
MTEVTVASYNIHKGIGIDRRRDLARIAKVIGELDADIVALQEADARFGDRRGLLDLEAMRRDLGLRRVEVEGHPLAHGWHGNVMLVKDGVEVADVHQIPLPGLEPRGAVVADLVVHGVAMRAIATHMALLGHSRVKQVATVLDRLAALTARPTVLMGDMNEWRRSSHTLRGFFPHFPENRSAPSFPAPYPILPLDRVMLSKGEIVSFAAHVSPLSRRASDHLPVRARLRLPA